ncbi:SpaA isopeptide-forming pilin-related protein [Streptococcus panodentis]|nr:SpaA isopeptide-forming pilin-related protein [Streptococcus panodentis]
MCFRFFCFGMTATEGQAVESWTSEAGKSKDINLAPGTYTFHEEAAPTGYLKVTDITFQVNHDGTVEVINVGEKAAKGETNTVATNGSTVTVTDKDDDLPRKVTFSKVNLGGTEIAGAEIQIFQGKEATGNPVAKWTSEANTSHELELAPGVYTFHEAAAPTGYLAVTDIVFQVNLDGTVTVVDANGNTVEYKDGKLVVTDQTKPTGPDKDPSKETHNSNPKKSNQDKPGDKGKAKKVLPFTGTEISFTLLAIGLIIIVGCGVYFGIRFKK